MKLHSN